MQYGVWLRGELGRRGVIEMEKQSNNPIKVKVAIGGEVEKMAKTSEPAKMPKKMCKGSRPYMAMVTNRRKETKALEKPTYELSYQFEKDLHEKGNIARETESKAS